MSDRTKREPNLYAERVLERLIINQIPASETAVNLLEAYDPNTEITITYAELNPDFDVGTFLAWVGARISRSPDTFVDIFRQVKALVDSGKISTGMKLGEVFGSYGHASVADMAPVYLFIDKAPDFAIVELLTRNNLGGPQHRSSRFQDFSSSQIMPIDKVLDLTGLPESLSNYVHQEWCELPTYALQLYSKWMPVIQAAHIKQFPEARKVAITTRTYDACRYFLPAGVKSSAMMLTSARQWLDLAAQLMTSHVPVTSDMGAHINAMFRLARRTSTTNSELEYFLGYDLPHVSVKDNTAEMAKVLPTIPFFQEIIDSYPPQRTISVNLINVEAFQINEKFTAGMLALAHYIQSIHPHIPLKVLKTWLENLDIAYIKQLARIMFKGHTDHQIMNAKADIRSNVELATISAWGGVRDLVRQRAAGRFVLAMETSNFEAVLNAGFSEIYQLSNTEGLKHLNSEFVADMASYYKRLQTLFYTIKDANIPNFDPSFIMHLILLGHTIPFSMTLPVNQKVYSYGIRGQRNQSGDFNYMMLMQKMLDAERAVDPVIAVLYEDAERIDPNNFDQFNARG